MQGQRRIKTDGRQQGGKRSGKKCRDSGARQALLCANLTANCLCGPKCSFYDMKPGYLFDDPEYDLSWQVFHRHLKRMYCSTDEWTIL